MNITHRGPIYRSRKGMIFGVCKGIARYFGISVFWFRMFVIIMGLITGIWPLLGLYVLAALILKPEPVKPIEAEDEEEFYQSYAASRTMAVHRLKRKFESLERRIRRLEDVVTSREYDWDRRFHKS
ncbi:MAG: envelope stress response membrane protein PspC [Desulfovibrionales bacterium]